jgi:hypothetical protein
LSTASVVLPLPPLAPGGRPETRARDLALADVKAALARARPECTVYALSNADHTFQIYAGLYALHRAGCIRLRQRYARHELVSRLAPVPLQGERWAKAMGNLFVDVEGVGLVFFDIRDSAGYFPEIVDRLALYAKRSFRRADYAASPGKFVPLGLNYSVYTDRACPAELVKSLTQLDGSRMSAKHFLVSLARLLPGAGPALGVPTVSRLSSPPDVDQPPKAIFFARTWEPAGPEDEGFEALNETRAECIRALRKAFGPQFLGGFSRSQHACRRYPDCVVGPELSTRRRDYLRRLRSYPVCVATTGLYGSIGWKFAEYVALSKAIVSEPLQFEPPGPMTAGENYLEFATPDACVAAVARLLADRDLRARMMARNRSYYLEYGAPDAVVGRVLHAALPAA